MQFYPQNILVIFQPRKQKQNALYIPARNEINKHTLFEEI